MPPNDRLSLDPDIDVVSRYVRQMFLWFQCERVGYGATLAEIKAADPRVELNDVYTNEGALVKWSDSSFKVTYNVRW